MRGEERASLYPKGDEAYGPMQAGNGLGRTQLPLSNQSPTVQPQLPLVRKASTSLGGSGSQTQRPQGWRSSLGSLLPPHPSFLAGQPVP